MVQDFSFFFLSSSFLFVVVVFESFSGKIILESVLWRVGRIWQWSYLFQEYSCCEIFHDCFSPITCQTVLGCLVICTLLVHFNRSHVFRNLSVLCFSTCWNSSKFSLIILWQNLWNTLWFVSTFIKLDFLLTSETICWFCYFQRMNSLLILCIVL